MGDGIIIEAEIEHFGKYYNQVKDAFYMRNKESGHETSKFGPDYEGLYMCQPMGEYEANELNECEKGTTASEAYGGYEGYEDIEVYEQKESLFGNADLLAGVAVQYYLNGDDHGVGKENVMFEDNEDAVNGDRKYTTENEMKEACDKNCKREYKEDPDLKKASEILDKEDQKEAEYVRGGQRNKEVVERYESDKRGSMDSESNGNSWTCLKEDDSDRTGVQRLDMVPTVELYHKVDLKKCMQNNESFPGGSVNENKVERKRVKDNNQTRKCELKVGRIVDKEFEDLMGGMLKNGQMLTQEKNVLLKTDLKDLKKSDAEVAFEGLDKLYEEYCVEPESEKTMMLVDGPRARKEVTFPTKDGCGDLKSRLICEGFPGKKENAQEEPIPAVAMGDVVAGAKLYAMNGMNVKTCDVGDGFVKAKMERKEKEKNREIMKDAEEKLDLLVGSQPDTCVLYAADLKLNGFGFNKTESCVPCCVFIGRTSDYLKETAECVAERFETVGVEMSNH